MNQDTPSSGLWEQSAAPRFFRLALLLVGVGLLWRGTRYFLAFPLWGDELMLIMNYFGRDYSDLLGHIDLCQIAPLLFHAAELTALNWLGTSEWAMRLPAFLACVGSVFLFWRLSRLLLPPLAHCLAVGIFAVAVWPVSMGSLCKPYAFDLFFSLALFLPAVRWLQQPDRWLSLLFLALIAPVAMLGSYPSAFVGGAVALVLACESVRRRDWKAMTLVGAYGLLLSGAFAWHYLAVGESHLASPQAQGTVTTGYVMTDYWKAGFPPTNPLHLLPWLFLMHAGQMAAYPLGAASGGSILTLALSVIGFVWMWRNQQRAVAAIVLVTFGLWFIAAFLHKYPYGLSCRLSQHVAPFYCLLAGLGGAALILRCQRESLRWRAVLASVGALVLIGLGGTAKDIWQPYREINAFHARQIMRDLLARAGENPIFTLSDMSFMLQGRWYLAPHAVRLNDHEPIAWDELARDHQSMWFLGASLDQFPTSDLETAVQRGGQGWICREQWSWRLAKNRPSDPLMECRVYHFVRTPETRAASVESPHNRRGP